MIDLTTRLPGLTPEEMLDSFVPGARFAGVNFDNYRADPNFPSQAQAKRTLEDFVARASTRRGGWFRRQPPGEGWYLDGGFGVGKTHLLAATWRAFAGKAAFLSFQELVYAVGALGMAEAERALGAYQLLALDEFELDDPGNTHLVGTLLGHLMPGGLGVVTTSNTAPGALGQGRFDAAAFGQQIEGIARLFTVLPVDGPDYRARGGAPGRPFTPAEYAAWSARQNSATLAELGGEALERHLKEVHPARFGKLLSGVGTVGLLNVRPFEDQNAALRFVHFADKVYDLKLGFALTGAPPESLFADTYRHGAYAKKYSRCLSRLSEMLLEARAKCAEKVTD